MEDGLERRRADGGRGEGAGGEGVDARDGADERARVDALTTGIVTAVSTALFAGSVVTVSVAL